MECLVAAPEWRFTTDSEKFIGEMLRSWCESRGVAVEDGVVIISLGEDTTECQYFGPLPLDAAAVHTIINTVSDMLRRGQHEHRAP